MDPLTQSASVPANINADQFRSLELHCSLAPQLLPGSVLSVHDLGQVSLRTFGALELPLILRAGGGAP